jgi:hypothetical protein
MSHTEPAAVDIPIGTPISVRPVVLPAPGRGEDVRTDLQDDRHPLGRLESR